MLFSAVWFWKLGALYSGALFFFGAVIFAGVGGVKRDILPIWLGWGGALVAIVGALVYVMDFWSTTATGAASQPMQWPAMRYGVGLPLQLWMLGVGAVMLRDYFASRPVVARVTHGPPRPVEHMPRRTPESVAPPAGVAGVGTPESPRAIPPRIPHPALAPDPEPGPPPARPGQATGTDPNKRPPPPQIFPG